MRYKLKNVHLQSQTQHFVEKMSIQNKHIRNTQVFQCSNYAVQRIILSKTNLLAIKRCYEDAKKNGFDDWEMKTTSSNRNKEIIKELLTNNKNKNGKQKI